MSHQGGLTSKLSTDIANLRRIVKRGQTEGKEPRPYTDEEKAKHNDRLQPLLDQQTEEKETRRAARVNTHTTGEADRVIKATKEAVQESTRHSESFFEAIGGAGSSKDLFPASENDNGEGKG